MTFLHDDKVFSLSKSSVEIPSDDIRTIYEKFFCYLFVAGMFCEGRGNLNNLTRNNNNPEEFMLISSGNFLYSESYDPVVKGLIETGLTNRYLDLISHSDITDYEKEILQKINSLFTLTSGPHDSLKGSDFLGIALRRDFDENMLAIAHYVAICFANEDFPETTTLPRIYLSLFGDIHLSLGDEITVTKPMMRFNDRVGDTKVTPLWALLSSWIDAIHVVDFPGDLLSDCLESFLIISKPAILVSNITYPRLAAAITLKNIISPNDLYRTKDFVEIFYSTFLCGNLLDLKSKITVSNTKLMLRIMDLIAEKLDEKDSTHLFNNNYLLKRINENEEIDIVSSYNLENLKIALEALDAKTDADTDTDADDTDDKSSDDDISSKKKSSKVVDTDKVKADPVDKKDSKKSLKNDADSDPDTEDGAYDPSNPPPAVPIGSPNMENNIGLISFDKNGENINDNLYRNAVVVLNAKIQNDNYINISADVKDALNYWVNGYLYLAAISSTKEQIRVLGLQSLLKNI